MKNFILLLVLCGFQFQINAQNKSVRFQHLSPADGLSQGHVLCMMQDREGYIWIGTYYGLNRYDGYSIKLFSKNNNDSTSIHSDVIYSLFEDKDGTIWVGTVSGLDKLNKETETFEHIPSYDPMGIRDGYIRKIVQDNKGDIWIGTNSGGLSKIDYKTKKVKTFYTGSKQTNQLPSNTVTDLFVDNNRLWIATGDGGLCVMDLDTYTIRTICNNPLDANSLPTNNISCIFGDKSGRIWIGDNEGNLAQYQKETDHFILHNFLPEEFKNQSFSIREISQDFEGNILVATLGAGLVSYNPLPGTSQIYLHNNFDNQSISSNEAYSLLVDRTGTVFVGTYGRGLSKYSPYNIKFSSVYISTGDEKEADMNSYTDCVQDSKGRLVIGSYYGFYIFDKKTWQYSHILPGKKYNDNKILCMAIAPDSSIWMGTKEGLHRYDKNFHKIRTYNLLNDNAEHPIYSIYFDDKNNLWLGLFVSEGLFKIPENEWSNQSKVNLEYLLYRSTNDSNSIPGNQIWCITQDRKKDLWIATNIGICKYDYLKDNFKRYKVTDLSKTIQFDHDNNMWVTTRGDGAFYFNLKTGKISQYTSEHGVSQNFVFGAIVDSQKKVWLTTEDGLSKFDPVTQNFRNYDIFDGLPHNQFDDRSEKQLADGEVYMGTSKGFMVFKPELIKDDTSKARIVLTKLKISNKTIEYYHLSGAENQINMPIGMVKELEFFSHQKDFSIEFAALHYSASHKIKYKYRLEGFDDQWISTDAGNRTARYTNLDGGKYVFKVMATNGDGVWIDKPLTIDIFIHPPLYKTLWFKFILFILLGIMIIAFIRWRVATVKKRNIILEKTVIERTLEIREMNTLLEENARDLSETNHLLEVKQQDIVEQKEELATQRDELFQLNRIKDKLFSVIAHDLKSPFNTIIGFSELVLSRYDKHDVEKRKNLLTNINLAARNAYHLLENLLEWSQNQQGTTGYNPVEIDLSNIIDLAISQVKEFAKIKEVYIYNEMADQALPGCVDPNMVNTILRNLLNNAVKFSRKHQSIVIMVSSKDELYWKISVVDQGVGMTAEVCDNLFVFDTNVSQIGTLGEKGTGLGLILCKDFVDAHNGHIWVESEVDKGTAIHFTVPKV